jgi:hypothetical protein
MGTKQARLEAECPNCGECFMTLVELDEATGETVNARCECPQCHSWFEMQAPLDCLEWDDDCNIERGRLG